MVGLTASISAERLTPARVLPRAIGCTGIPMNKFVEPRPFADPEAAARKLMEIANAVEPVQDGRIHIEKINGPFLYEHRGNPAEYDAGLRLAIDRGWPLAFGNFECCNT
jgi:hypothetical protein